MNESPELVLQGGSPIRQQIEGQIRRLVRSGALRPGEELPTIRAVAVGLAVNPHAVEQAYDRLEKAGFVTHADGSGPRVAEPPDGPSDADLRELREMILRWAAERGHSFVAVLHALQACLEEEVCHDQAH
jgi:GntR family transcriptional regulator